MLRHAHDRPARRRPSRLRAALASGALLTAGLVPLTLTAAAGPARAATPSGDVIANLFMWNWPSVARECTDVLGPDGYGGVQVAPPADSLSTSGHPWWEVYQPVDYHLTSRMGDESAFRSMVATCRKAGVKVYVDAVINHTSGVDGTSYGGVTYTKYAYPDYTDADFHHYPADCPQSDGQIHNWNDYTEVTHCELLHLADLRTESAHVRTTLTSYLDKLIDYGVSGFRVDAAKHIGHEDLAAIEAQLHTTADGTRPYIAQEIAPGGTGDLSPASFENTGDVLGFDYADGLKSAFTGSLASLRNFSAGLLGSDQEEVFVQNHDTERDGSTLSYRDGAVNTLATEFELAYGYGTPQVYAGFDFTGKDDSPPADASGHVTDTTCGTGWECTDRIPGVAAMVGWHDTVAGAPVADWYDDGADLIAFGRGGKGWIALNNGSTAQQRTFATGLPAGSYCDVIHGRATATGPCTGPAVTVDAAGDATVTVPAKDAVAIDVAARGTSTTATVPVSFDPTVTTWYGQNVYVTGSLPALGGWDPGKAVALSPADYPVWKATVALPANTPFEYKYVKKDPDGTVEWESGGNRTATTGASGGLTLNDTWK